MRRLLITTLLILFALSIAAFDDSSGPGGDGDGDGDGDIHDCASLCTKAETVSNDEVECAINEFTNLGYDLL